MGTIRIETDGASDMSRVYGWLAKHRGQVVALDTERTLTLGAPKQGLLLPSAWRMARLQG